MRPFPEELSELVRNDTCVAYCYSAYQSGDFETLDETLVKIIRALASMNKAKTDQLIKAALEQPPPIAVPAEAVKLKKAIDLLMALDNRGGLGLDIHRVIKETLKEIS